MKKHRYGNEFQVTAVKMATARDIETKAVAEALSIHPFMLSRCSPWPLSSLVSPRSAFSLTNIRVVYTIAQ
jgi:hypothetical protein